MTENGLRFFMAVSLNEYGCLLKVIAIWGENLTPILLARKQFALILLPRYNVPSQTKTPLDLVHRKASYLSAEGAAGIE